MSWRAMLERILGRVPDAAHIVPAAKKHAEILAASDYVLANPRIMRLEEQSRRAHLRGSFDRAQARLTGR